MKKTLALLFLVLVISHCNLAHNLKRKQILPKPIIPAEQLLKINPLAVQLALKLHPRNRSNNGHLWIVVFSKNIKDLIFNIYKGFLVYSLKNKFDPNKVFDSKQQKDVRVNHSLKEITCKNPQEILLSAHQPLSRLYQEIYFMDIKNYLKKPQQVSKLMLKLILSAGHNCDNMIEYYKYFHSHVVQKLDFLKKINNKVQNKILAQLAIQKNHFLHSWGDYEKMGTFLGHLFSAFYQFKPVSKERSKILGMKRLFEAFNNEEKRDKLEKALEKKYKSLMGDEEEGHQR